MALLNKQHRQPHFKRIKKIQQVKRKRYRLDFLDVYPALREDMGYYSWRLEATFLFGLRKDPKISKGQTFDLLKQNPEFIVSETKPEVTRLASRL